MSDHVPERIDPAGRAPHRLSMTASIMLVLVTLLAACSATGGPSGSPLVPGSTTPLGAISASEAIARQAELDGRRVTVASGLWADGTIQLLSDVMMESYPPQVPRDSSLVLQGTVPATIWAQLEHARPGYADVTWGQVVVSGTLHAGSDHVPPILELVTIALG